ncbi:MAG: hypothetical protein ACO3PI_06150, partial [Burkholderiaceae bacterium]
MNDEHFAGMVLHRISSKGNPEFRRLFAAQDQAEVRRENGLCWLEGPRLIQQFLQAVQHPSLAQLAGAQWRCDTLVFSEGWLQSQGPQALWQ